jgi:hypothetical protein
MVHQHLKSGSAEGFINTSVTLIKELLSTWFIGFVLWDVVWGGSC